MITRASWPAQELDRAVVALARYHGLGGRVAVRSSSHVRTDMQGGGLVEAAAADLGLEAEAVVVPYADIEPTLRRAAPALLRLEVAGTSRWLALVAGSRRHLHVLNANGRRVRLRSAIVRRRWCAAIEAPLNGEINGLLAAAGLAGAARARRALLRGRLGARRLDGLWLLRLPPAAPFRQGLRKTGFFRQLGCLAATHAAQYGIGLLAWWAVAVAVLGSRFEPGWLLAWALLLATFLPLRLAATWQQGCLAVQAGGALKRRLLNGALRQRLDDVRRAGVGQLLGRVLESNAIEGLALTGGVQAAVATIEVAMAALVLSVGAGSLWPAAVLAVWLAVSALLGLCLYRHQSTWTAARLGLTHGLVERMVGHRTRLAQEPPHRRHLEEDIDLANYHEEACAMDAAATWIQAVVPRGWLVVGVTVLMPSFVRGPSSGELALALGGTILAYQALDRMALGIGQLVEAVLAGRHVAGLFRAGAEVGCTAALGTPTQPVEPVEAPAQQASEPVLEAQGIAFRYAPHAAPVLDDVTLQIHAGDRILLEGPSGGGKSTLAALLSGLRKPTDGLVLLRGLDLATLGTAQWRRRVAAAPQFHHNHVLTGTFAFNLLMGRAWPPSQDDVEAAERLCRRLGLGTLLDRMPAGLFQSVGETGWQLSHGERSRLFLARALLQDADVVILDESLGSLDPENRSEVLRVILDEAPALIVIAHP